MLAENIREQYTYLPKEKKDFPKRKKRIVKRRNNKLRFIKSSIKMALVFGVSVMVLYGHTSVTQVRMDIDNIQSKKEALKSEKNYLVTNLEELKTKAKIEDRAILELGMDYPRENQVVYINVEENNKEIVSDSKFGSFIKSITKGL